MINGYAGGSKEIHLALERGEVEGRGGNSWASLTSSNQSWIDEKKLNFLVQIDFEPEPEIRNIPLLIDLVKTEEHRQIVTVVSLPTVLGYANWVAPEVPSDRLKALRTAYDATMKDPEFLADAKKLSMILKPQTGEQIESLVKRAAATPKSVLDQTAKLLDWQE